MDWRVRSVTRLLLLGCLLAFIVCGAAGEQQRVVCYYTNWSVYRPGTAKFSPQNINPYLCTHLIYAFGGFTKDNALKPFDKYQDIEKGGYAKFTGLKTYNKNLKTMLAIGGWNEGSTRFSPMVADPERRKEFVRNTVKFLRQNHFDGLDLDWEYPAFRDGGKPRDKDNYAALVQELREAYERESSKTGRPRLLLSMAVPAGVGYIDKGYDIPKLDKYLDFINLLSYDYHSSYEPAVNHHSPLYPLEEDNEYNFDTELTVDYTIKHLLESGATADKIVLGIPTYGRSYTLFNEEATDIGSPADGPGEEGDATREKGYLAYYEICESLMDSDEWEVVSPNPSAMGPYAYKGNQWVGYDDENIVRRKAMYVTEHGLGGIMFWSIDNDDFRGKCHDRPYPLIEAAKEAMLVGGGKTATEGKVTDKRTRGNFIGKRPGAGRRRTTEAPVRRENPRKRIDASKSRKRPATGTDSEERDTPVHLNGRSRGQFDDSEDEQNTSSRSRIGLNIVRSADYEEDDDGGSSLSETRNRPRDEQGRRRRPEVPRRRTNTPTTGIPQRNAAQARSNRITTPAPPTTPDPGTDFKCTDEGFFSHPRDCKKYFWCLDAGPGGLGIVAHHFTCPAGLVFNKAADSCDYPRNVICPKVKPVEIATTRAPKVTSTHRPTRISSTTRRSVDSHEYSEEYEYYDDDDDEESEDDGPSTVATSTTARNLLYKTINRNRSAATSTFAPTTTGEIPKAVTSRSYQSLPSRGSTASPVSSTDESEEDPQVLKELIKLIKKAGGIEEVEKQLHLQGKGGESNARTGSATHVADVTPATISRSLYERVLNRQAANSGSSLFRRTTPSPNTVTEVAMQRSDPQPAVISRSRPSYRNGPGETQFEGLDDLPEVKNLRKERPQYVTINRQRPSTGSAVENNEEILQDNTDGTSLEDRSITNPSEQTSNTPKETRGYVDIRRSRTSTARTNAPEVEDEDSFYDQIRDPVKSGTIFLDEVGNASEVPSRRRNESVIDESETPTTTSRYLTIERVRSTTQRINTSPENDEQIIENTTESTSPATGVTRTIPFNNKMDKNSVPETTTANREIIEQSDVVDTANPVVQPMPTTLSTNFLSTDLPVLNLDTRTASSPSIVKAGEELPHAKLIPVVASPSTQESSDNDDSITKETPIVVHPKPFGFQRRTRPTTTTTAATTVTLTPETTSSGNTDTGRVKVPLETVKLPTLKELIGYKTIIAHEYKSTTPITLSTKNSSNDYEINTDEHSNNIDTTEATAVSKNDFRLEDVTSIAPTGIDEAIQATEEDRSGTVASLDAAGIKTSARDANDRIIAESDELIASTDPSPPATIPIKILQQDRPRSRKRKIKLVNIPVRILESDRPVTDVILEVPESKLNSVLRSLLRVEILKPNDTVNGNGVVTQIMDSYNQSNGRGDSHENKVGNVQNKSGSTVSDELLEANLSGAPFASEHSFPSTTPDVTTVRGHILPTSHAQSRSRGFYVTKSIESNILYESSTLPSSTDVTQLNTDSTQQFPATVSDNDSSTVATHGSATATDHESTTQEIWPSTITTSLENLNNILSADDNSGSQLTLVTQSSGTEADATSEEYTPTSTINTNGVESTTDTTFTTSNDITYTTPDSEEVSTSNNTAGIGSITTEEISPEPDRNLEMRTTLYSTKINPIDAELDFFTASTTASEIQSTTIIQNTNGPIERTDPGIDATGLTTTLDFYAVTKTPDSQTGQATSDNTSTKNPNFEKISKPDRSEPASATDETDFIDTTSSLNAGTMIPSSDPDIDMSDLVTTDSTWTGPVTTQILPTTDFSDSENIKISQVHTETTTVMGDSESTTETGITVTSPTLINNEPTKPQLEILNQSGHTSATSERVDLGLESTVAPSNKPSEATTGRDTSIIDTATQEEDVIAKPSSSTQFTGLVYRRRGPYKSPTAVPGKNKKRRVLVRKRIYGIRRPHVVPVADNETAVDVKNPNTGFLNKTINNPRRRYVRRRIINHATGEIVDETREGNRTVVISQTVANNSNPEIVRKVNNSPEMKNDVVQKLLRHRAIYRRRPIIDQKNQRNSSIEANISSQNNSASMNDVQSSSVSSANPNQRRRIVVQRFRSRDTGLAKSFAVGSSQSQSLQRLVRLEAADINRSDPTESTVEDGTTKGQGFTDIIIDNLTGGSETYATVSLYEREELPRTESIAETQFGLEPALQSEDVQASDEINLFKTRAGIPRTPGTLNRPLRPITSTTTPGTDTMTTVSSLTPTDTVTPRQRFHQSQRPTAEAIEGDGQSRSRFGDDGPLKSEVNRDLPDSLDQTVHAQEVKVTVALGEFSSPTPPTVKGRPPFRTSIRRKIVTTEAPQVTVSPTTTRTVVRQRQRPEIFEKINRNVPAARRHPAIVEYDYYEDSDEGIVGRSKISSKIAVGARGSIQCLDQGNFPHPTSCKMFISCAKLVSGEVIGTEYTCPKRLSFDPIGGICNWSAGLGCKE
ncbi:uncharacterized threonine-rich GPI-anchored glycoprotein PJ4664.02 isoform X1 [Athalia rosae]|uniref:uncharacterized threonine-rich GPI-anchored glycoprotein PJ4664.02 isoform X1 n=2 Tax=Athalia rosae TaxID=37344 RepID=UPI0020346480|nr:uncharacterized threonine-rich GPI-anchored glycoprotein PJ4664.02 isoform X1 [Athalia rosae]XP_048509391.1 uncharacterized threonine-rich GPI-anchored glycoprotein PJ4664.02 isoform X1 [Athalia rosae]XP_048509392.1 uncharacterized threonine-rich GPI-anchored glycoprotein PJ4664.02 isoform X1 [Athalia rosae]